MYAFAESAQVEVIRINIANIKTLLDVRDYAKLYYRNQIVRRGMMISFSFCVSPCLVLRIGLPYLKNDYRSYLRRKPSPLDTN